jgi:hypothetical protein
MCAGQLHAAQITGEFKLILRAALLFLAAAAFYLSARRTRNLLRRPIGAAYAEARAGRLTSTTFELGLFVLGVVLSVAAWMVKV